MCHNKILWLKINVADAIVFIFSLLSLILKNKRRLMKALCCLYAPLPHRTFECSMTWCMKARIVKREEMAIC
jgi:hypothetical protein